jgi:hypothetical protein
MSKPSLPQNSAFDADVDALLGQRRLDLGERDFAFAGPRDAQDRLGVPLDGMGAAVAAATVAVPASA